MRRLVMMDLARAGSLSDGEGAAIELEISEGPLEIRFTYEDAERLVTALQAAQQKIQAQRAHSAQPPLAETAKPVVRWETAIDPVNQDAVIRARYSDQTTQETRIPRSDLPSSPGSLTKRAGVSKAAPICGSSARS